mgnify:CR=1 FL=1
MNTEQNTKGNTAGQQRKRILITLLTVVFGVVMLFLVTRGGMCERYERKMERQRYMRDYIDSMRMESDKAKSRKSR